MFKKIGLVMTVKKISILIITGVISSVIVYAVILLWLTWPISEYSINKSGVFGDSFGLLTALFSGLAFSGVIITILLQKEELKLQRQELSNSRIEFEKMATANDKSAKLSALSTLLLEYKSQIEKNDETIESGLSVTNNGFDPTLYLEENADLINRKTIIRNEIEKMLEDIGLNLKS